MAKVAAAHAHACVAARSNRSISANSKTAALTWLLRWSLGFLQYDVLHPLLIKMPCWLDEYSSRLAYQLGLEPLPSRIVDARPGDLDVFPVDLHADKAESFQDGCLASAA